MIKENNDKILLTEEGLKKLKEEYKMLTEKKRPEVTARIQAAREMGDLSENAAYHTAREDQSFIEGRIQELQQILKNAEIVHISDGKKKISIGSKVRVNIGGDEEEFWIVGAPEANPAENRISHESPLGQSLMGKRVGEQVEIETPEGQVKYTVVEIL